MEAFEELMRRWESDALTSRTRFGDDRVAHVTELHLEELQEAVREHFDDLLTQSEAAEFSGYTPRTLRRWVKKDKLSNHGKKGAPLFRRGDLPRKAGRLHQSTGASHVGSLSREEIVQRVLNEEEDADG